MGRDLFSAILYGLRVSFTVGVAAGASCARARRDGWGSSQPLFYGGRIEALIMRNDRPSALHCRRSCFALVLVAVLGQGMIQLIVALVAGPIRLFRPHYPRRGERRGRRKDYIEATLYHALPRGRLLFKPPPDRTRCRR